MFAKQVIFNVGGAFCSYLQLDDKKIIFDLGKSSDFNPVLDFLLPLAKHKFSKSQDKYWLDQTFISHLDNDHISAIQDFDKYFNPKYLTAPCKHPRQNNIFNVIESFFTDENENREKVLSMMSARLPGYGREIQEDYDKPLIVYQDLSENIELYYIPSNVCGSEEGLAKNYSNNLSLVLFVKINGHTILIPGDIMDEGMEYLINTNAQLKSGLQTMGVDFLVAPHHGLSTSFPESLFSVIEGGKTRRLNIISEKMRIKSLLENRSEVDSRYYEDTYCLGDNSLGFKGLKTSRGHILIDYSGAYPVVNVIETNATEALLKEFIQWNSDTGV